MPPAVNVAQFFGRGYAMFRLREALVATQRNAVAGIYGGPGFGKSALAARFAERYASSFPGGVITVDCREHRDDASIAYHFATLVGEPVDPDREGTLSAWQVIQSRFCKRRCLLILDNADQKGIINLTPARGSALLVTSRDREVLLALPVPEAACIGLTPLIPAI